MEDFRETFVYRTIEKYADNDYRFYQNNDSIFDEDLKAFKSEMLILNYDGAFENPNGCFDMDFPENILIAAIDAYVWRRYHYRAMDEANAFYEKLCSENASKDERYMALLTIAQLRKGA